MYKEKLTTEEFIRRAKLKHGDKYDYSETQYFGKFKKLKIVCRTHGEFHQEAHGHLKGKGCIDCSGFKPLTTEIFIQRSKEIHSNKYTYTKSIYVSRRKPIIITCLIHGDFTMTADQHLSKRGCPKCAGFYQTEEEFIKEATLIHGNKYDYSKLNYNNKNNGYKIDIICPKHGIFKMTKSCHIKGKQGCPICSESKGERIIKKYLKEHNINFISQKKFTDCRNELPLPFDFYIPDKNILIEYDGIQHYKIIEWFGGKKTFAYIRKNDNIKTEYCINKGIDLLRIKYDENILNKLQEKLLQ